MATPQDTSPEAYLKTSRDFCDAANELLRVAKKRKVDLHSSRFTKPVQLLYFHSIECSLKAYLGVMGQKIPKGHAIKEYYKECKRLGLPRDRKLFDENAVGLLSSANADHGIRYFNLKSHWQPSMRVAKNGSRFILQSVEKEFAKRGLDTTKPGKVAKIIVTFDVGKKKS